MRQKHTHIAGSVQSFRIQARLVSKNSNLLPGRVREEVVGPDVFAEHDVIVEVDELVREAGDLVQVTLDGGRRERRQVALVREDLLNVNNH